MDVPVVRIGLAGFCLRRAPSGGVGDHARDWRAEGGCTLAPATGEEIGISIEIASTGGATLSYIWAADGGEIVRGQGSPAITYRVPKDPGTYNIRVKVEWEGHSVEKVTSVKVEGTAASTLEAPADTAVPNPADMQKPPTATPTPQATNMPKPTNTPRSTPVPTATIDADPTVYDNFNNPAFDGKWNTGLWVYGWNSNLDNTPVEQKDGVLIISRRAHDNGGLDHGPLKFDEIGFVEAKLMLDGNIKASKGDVGILLESTDWWLNCSIFGGQQNSNGWANCSTSDNYQANGIAVQYNSWHIMRFEINPDTSAISFFIDGQQIGSYISTTPEIFKKTQFNPTLRVWSEDGSPITGYFDDVRIGPIGQ